MKTERDGQRFGIRCWEAGMSVKETVDKAANECGFEEVPSDPTKWPKFVHGAEEGWQDKNLKFLDEQSSLSKIKGKYVK